MHSVCARELREQELPGEVSGYGASTMLRKMTREEYTVFREVVWLLHDYVAAVDPDEKRSVRVDEVLKRAYEMIEAEEGEM